MSRWVLVLLVSGLVGIAQPAQKKGDAKQPQLKQRNSKDAEKEAAPGPEQAPPEEDETLSVKKEYAFNPLQAKKELQIGNFYFKKGSFRAAALRFREATRWDQTSSEAWLRLAEADEKQNDSKAAREAYAKYLELEPDAKNAESIRKKIQKLSTHDDAGAKPRD